MDRCDFQPSQGDPVPKNTYLLKEHTDELGK